MLRLTSKIDFSPRRHFIKSKEMIPSTAAGHSYLWKSDYQNTRVFNWDEIINETTHSSKHYKDVLILNLVAYVKGNTTFPLTHFLAYVNEEPAGIKFILSFLHQYIGPTTHSKNAFKLLNQLVKKINYNEPFGFADWDNKSIATHFLTHHNSSLRWWATITFNSLKRDENINQKKMINCTNSCANTCANGFVNNINNAHVPVPVPAPAAAPTPAPAARSSAPVQVPKTFYYPLNTLKYAPIAVHLQQKGGKPVNDDVLNIRRTGFGTFSLTYKNKLDNGKTYLKEELSSSDVLRYFGIYFGLLAADMDPFVGMTVHIPGVPSVQIERNPPSWKRDVIYDAVEDCLNHWPVDVC